MTPSGTLFVPNAISKPDDNIDAETEAEAESEKGSN